MLTIFLALVFLVFVWNTAMLWLIHMRVRETARQTAQAAPAVQTFLDDLKLGVGRLEAASQTAVEWSARAKARVEDLEGPFDRADNWVRYGLARVDFEVDRVSEQLEARTEEVQEAVSEPLSRTAAVVQGVRVLLEFALAIRQRTGSNNGHQTPYR